MRIGMEKKLDKLGRVTIPKKFRDFYHFAEKVTLVETENGILITNPLYTMVEIKRD